MAGRINYDLLRRIRTQLSTLTGRLGTSETVAAHEGDYDHTLLHSSANDPTAGQKAALAGSSGTPADGNRYVTNGDSRMTDSRTPSAHAASHKSAGSDAVKLDELAAPTDITTLNATTGLHGLLPKLGGGTTNFLRADGTWAEPSAGTIVRYSITLMASLLSTIADSQTYYFGGLARAPQTTSGQARIYIPKAGTIKSAVVYLFVTGEASTEEEVSVYIRKNNTTDTLIETRGLGAAQTHWSNDALSISIAVDDYLEIKVVCPEWATNPSGGTFGGSIYIE